MGSLCPGGKKDPKNTEMLERPLAVKKPQEPPANFHLALHEAPQALTTFSSTAVAESVPEPVRQERPDQKPEDTDENLVHDHVNDNFNADVNDQQMPEKIEEPLDLQAPTEPSLHEACDHHTEEEPAQVDTEIDPQQKEFLKNHGIRIVKQDAQYGSSTFLPRDVQNVRELFGFSRTLTGVHLRERDLTRQEAIEDSKIRNITPHFLDILAGIPFSEKERKLLEKFFGVRVEFAETINHSKKHNAQLSSFRAPIRD